MPDCRSIEPLVTPYVDGDIDQTDRDLVDRWLGHRNDVSALAPLWRGGIDPYRVDMAAAGAIVAAFSVSCAIRIVRERRDADSRAHADRVKHRFSLN